MTTTIYHICAFAVLCLMKTGMVSTDNVFEKPCAAFGATPMINFDKTRYIGQWFVHQMLDYDVTVNYNCYTQIYTMNPNGTLGVTQILVNPGIQPELNGAGLMTFDQSGTGRFVYSSPGYTETQAYDILSTDYLTYTMEWACTDSGASSVCYLFVMSRTPVVTPITQQQIDAQLSKLQIDKTQLRTLDITSCPASLTQPPPSDNNGGGGLLGIIGGLLGGVLGAVGSLLG